MYFSFHFCRTVSEVAAFHPDNPKLWDGMVEREKAILFHFKTFKEVFEVCPPEGIDFYCYFVILDEHKRLAAWMPGYFSERQATVVYGRGPTNKKGEWARKIIFATPWGRARFPQQICTRDLVIGHDMDQGNLFVREDVAFESVVEVFLRGVEEVRKALRADSLSFLDVNLGFAQRIGPFLRELGFVRRCGNGYSYIDLEKFRDFGAYFEGIQAVPHSTFAHKGLRKMLEGNFLPRELQEHLKKKDGQLGVSAGVSVKDVVAKYREQALQLSRNNQTRLWLESNGMGDFIPPLNQGEKRKKYLAKAAEVLWAQGYIADMNYITQPVSANTIDGIFPLWQVHNQRYGMETPYIRKEWFLAMAQHAQGVSLFQTALWGGIPMGFFFVQIHLGIYYAMFCGFDPVIGRAQHLYFNMHLQAVLEGNKRQARLLALGPGDGRMAATKKKILAFTEPAVSFIAQEGFRLAFHRKWVALRLGLRKVGIKIGRFEVFPKGYLMDPPQEPILQGANPDIPQDVVALLKSLSAEKN